MKTLNVKLLIMFSELWFLCEEPYLCLINYDDVYGNLSSKPFSFSQKTTKTPSQMGRGISLPRTVKIQSRTVRNRRAGRQSKR